VSADPPPDLALTPLNGRSRTVDQLLTTFHLCFVALDPRTAPSRLIIPTAARILSVFEQADVRVAWLVAGDAEDARRLLGRWADEILTFVDPEREAIRGFGLQRLPAIVHVAMDGTVVNASEGWHPLEWKRLTDHLAKVTAWKGPSFPLPRDPAPFDGTPALR
jgi:hypothetical protein